MENVIVIMVDGTRVAYLPGSHFRVAGRFVKVFGPSGRMVALYPEFQISRVYSANGVRGIAET